MKQYQKILGERRYLEKREAEGITVCPCDYKTGNTPPPASAFSPFANGGVWGSGKDSHAWFRLNLSDVSENDILLVSTDQTGWDAGNPQLPIWQGELYLEFHRGTYTTQANNKKNNRKGELLYQNAELLATLDKTLFGTEFPQRKPTSAISWRTNWKNCPCKTAVSDIPSATLKS